MASLILFFLLINKFQTGKLILTTGDGGSGYDSFNLSQNDLEIAGKIIEIDVVKNTFVNNPPVVTWFNELPASIQETLTVIAKGVRNIPDISFQWLYNQCIKYVGNVGQDLMESIFSFVDYKLISVSSISALSRPTASMRISSISVLVFPRNKSLRIFAEEGTISSL